ncbi:MAG TPA: copper-binding protein, partial [Terriglobales bacterium]|nr:copper-binding protein [Terriglobales bacterium]
MSLRKILAIIIASFSFATACHPGAKRYHMRGQVMDKNVATNEITIDHEDIPGFMAAMTMPYKVKDPAVVQEVEPGDKIAADVVTTTDGTDY